MAAQLTQSWVLLNPARKGLPFCGLAQAEEEFCRTPASGVTPHPLKDTVQHMTPGPKQLDSWVLRGLGAWLWAQHVFAACLATGAFRKRLCVSLLASVVSLTTGNRDRTQGLSLYWWVELGPSRVSVWRAQPTVAPHAIPPENRVTADVTSGEEACWRGVLLKGGLHPQTCSRGTPRTYGGRGRAGAAVSPGEPKRCPQGGSTTLTVNFCGSRPSAHGPLLWKLECLCLLGSYVSTAKSLNTH